ncbi:50S ribosomal protein L4 [Candidatus Woesearchaeota archaeon]|nr:50S ribosomal protein L4 [Candidatus Woesearchaeota archaeon]
MNLAIMSVEQKPLGSRKLPPQFEEAFRPDIIRRAVLALQNLRRQPYGTSPVAGKRASALMSKRRRDYNTTYGIGQSRTPRKIMSHRGTRMNWAGAFAPQTVGGRKAHPPKASKIWVQKINRKESRKALRSAIAASVSKEIVAARGHRLPENFPFIIESKIENMDKTKNVRDVLEKLGFERELERASVKSVRSGKGKMRGRKYVKRNGPLIVVENPEKIRKAARNLPGVLVVAVDRLNAEQLAPGALPGRLTLWTEAAINKLEKEKLFLK